ncbi:hypothetical protein chiPu_0016586 [Chiloscyllium punctatum]|uniref:Maestro heat-like repeat-containing protein family member 1 n=1 Tax=Chiloscyllium punctatum TaxID=137246 RepID=A0A401T623_CHIPU|nr:hypothetical protein [Chiloscyllium punctatum]
MHRNVELFSASLIKMTAEEDEDSRKKILNSLYILGCHHPEMVLTVCHDYLSHHSTLTGLQGAVIFDTMTMITKKTLEQISEGLAQKILSLAALWITKLTGSQADSQEAASNLLVTMSFRFMDQVLQLTMENLKEGNVPNAYMVKTLTKMSTENTLVMMPFLKSIIGTMIPVLFGVKQDELKVVFAAALGSFSKSILLYLENTEKASDLTVTKDSFYSEISTVYSTFFKVWLQKEPSKLNIQVVEALGYVSSLLPKDKFEKELPKMIPAILSLYKKQPGHFSITECLRQLLDAAMEMGHPGLKTQLDNLLNNLHQQICLSVGANNQYTTKNQTEILRCFIVLAPIYADSLVDFLLLKLENTEQQMRVGTLTVLRHLISSVSSHLERKQVKIVAAIKPMLQMNCTNHEKKLIAQVICAMAQHGYLEPEEGKATVEFLIRQCAASIDSTTSELTNHQEEQVTDEDLATVCETVMFMITNTVKMEDALWPFLLECVTMTQYTKALTTICNCLAHLGKKKPQGIGERFSLIYSGNTNVPRAQALLARLLLVSCCPNQGRSRAAAALRLLQVLNFNIHPATASWWDEELPALVDQLQGHLKECLHDQEWEEKLLLFLSKTLNIIDDEEWTSQLGDEMYQQIDTHDRSPQEKGFLYKALGIVLSQVRKRNIKEELHQMLLSVQHNENAEREGAAIAIGFCAMTHFNDTLSSLEEFANSNRIMSTNSFFHNNNDKPDVDLDQAKSTLVLCYGNMALYTPEELLSRIESHILSAISEFITSGNRIKAKPRNLTLKLSIIKAVTMIAKSLHSNYQSIPFNFIRKRELLMYMQNLIQDEPQELLHGPVRKLAMIACLHLVQLHTESNQTDILTSQLIHTCLTSTFSILPLELDKDKDMASSKDSTTLYIQTITALQELLKEILLQDLSSEGVQAMFQQFEEWIISTKDYERERAMDMILVLLKYMEKLDAFPLINMGTLIGQIMPHCADPLISIGQIVIDCLYTIFNIQLSYGGTNLDQYKEQLEVLKSIRQALAYPDTSVLLQTCLQITEVISKCTPHEQLGNLLLMAFKGLSDQQLSCSSAAAILIKTIIKKHGNELQNQVPELLEVLRSQLQLIRCKEAKLSVLRSIAILAKQNTAAVVSCLLTYPVPLDMNTTEIWRSLAEDTDCAPITIQVLLDTLNKQLPTGEKKTYPIYENVALYPNAESLAVTCALYQIINTPTSAQAVIQLFPKLFSTLLIHLNSSINVYLPKVLAPDSEARQFEFVVESQTPRSGDMCMKCAETLMDLLDRTGKQQVLNCLIENGGWNLMMDIHKSVMGIVLLVKTMASYTDTSLTRIIDELAEFMPSLQECQKITVAAFFGELLRSSLVLQLQLTDTLMNRLLQWLPNSSPVLQLLCIKGLDNITTGAPQCIEKYSRQVLYSIISMMGSREHNNEVLMFEVLSCLDKHLNLLKTSTIKPFLIKILTAVQPFFEFTSDKIRAEAFTVLGSLAKCGTRDPKSCLCRQIHLNLVRLLLQLDGNSKEVSRSCNSTLHSVIPLIISAKAVSVIVKYLEEPTLKYMEFLRVISQQLIKDFPERIHGYIMDCMSYFNNPEEQLRANAVTLSGLFFRRPEKHSRSVQRFT